ncbi:MAG: DoxX family protein [Propionicimonas sp.]|uniref:DoxX family protein n=1 Tax=Propionicimonas sp. TaxID=1955623 RepID=UPI002B20CFD4|nr:DoxX family protein [Propionicimonas sp.]MEA4945160.1 DoxX family protein [Propionicimonas sp.]MEA5118917.1 DoxX family protein [Propionicimonas sp.]
MTITLWIINILLALVFLGAGAMHAFRPRQALAENMAWTADSSDAMVKTIGALELLGALGLILPLATGIAPILTPIAAIGLAIVMVGAVVTHARRSEPIITELVLALVAAASAVLGFLVLA